MRALLWIVRIIFLLFLARFALRFFSNLRRRAVSGPRDSHLPRGGGTLVRDPQCGTHVSEARAVVLEDGGTALHFCSTACRDAWRTAHAAPAASRGQA